MKEGIGMVFSFIAALTLFAILVVIHEYVHVVTGGKHVIKHGWTLYKTRLFPIPAYQVLLDGTINKKQLLKFYACPIIAGVFIGLLSTALVGPETSSVTTIAYLATCTHDFVMLFDLLRLG